MALPIIAAGMIARYGAKKLAKKLVTRVGKKERKKLAKQKKDDQVRYTIKGSDGTRYANTDKISVKKLYRGSREMDGSYTDPGNKILRESLGVNIGRRPIGKNPNKVKKTNKSPMSLKKRLIKHGYSLKDLER